MAGVEPRPPWPSPFLALVVRVFMVGIGLALLGISFWVGAQADNSHRWPTAQGVVTGARVAPVMSGHRPTPYTEALIEYRYVVNGQTHHNDVLGFRADSARFGRRPEDIVAGYAVGTAVTVYYHPDNPRQSVIEPGVGSPMGALGLLVALGVLGVLAGVFLGPLLALTRGRRG